MTGSLTEKNGKYYIVLNLYEGSRRKRKWIATGLPVKGNKRKADQMLREKIQEYEHSPNIAKSDMLLSDYIRRWLTIVQRRIDVVTYQGYEILATTHLLPISMRTASSCKKSPGQCCKPTSMKRRSMAAKTARAVFPLELCKCTRMYCIRHASKQLKRGCSPAILVRTSSYPGWNVSPQRHIVLISCKHSLIPSETSLSILWSTSPPCTDSDAAKFSV